MIDRAKLFYATLSIYVLFTAIVIFIPLFNGYNHSRNLLVPEKRHPPNLNNTALSETGRSCVNRLRDTERLLEDLWDAGLEDCYLGAEYVWLFRS